MFDVRHRFPAVTDGSHPGWARFDGPAGTQVVDAAIEASAAWQRSGDNANSHGSFDAAHACDALVERVRRTMGEFLGADPAGFVFGPSTTANVFALTRAIGRSLEPGDEIVCTRLDHDSNVAPWLLIARDTGATVRFAEFDPSDGRLNVDAVTSTFTTRTKWVAVTGASNAIGTRPDVSAITTAAHGIGARVVVDGVHLTPHAPVDLGAIGCDVYSTSSYKWYGPHVGITWMSASVIDDLDAYRVRPAADRGADRWMLGTPAYEQLAGVDAAARWLMDTGMGHVVEHESMLFRRLLDGLLADERVTVYGPHDLVDRAPTLAFAVTGHSPEDVARALARARIAVWDGDYYAVEAMATLGIPGAVRAGIAAYLTTEDVDRLLDAVVDLPDSNR